MRLFKIPLLLLALIGLIALSGCGGDDSGEGEGATTSTSSEELTPEEYGQQVQFVLGGFAKEFASLSNRLGRIDPREDPQELSSAVSEGEATLQAVIEDFGAIQPPDEAEDGHDQVLAALEDFSSKLGDVGEAAESGDDQALKDAGLALRRAGSDFQQQIEVAALAFQEAGISLDGGSSATSGG